MKTKKIQSSIILWIILLVGVSVGCNKTEPEALVSVSEVTTNSLKSAVIDSSKAVYIDPSATVNGTGTKASPLNGSTLPSDPWKANTPYLFKRGTTYSHSNKINIQVAGVILGAYGTGAMPKILQTANTDNIIGSGSITVQDLELIAPSGSGGQDADQLAFWPGTGYLTVTNCKIHGGFQGVRVYLSPTMDVTVTNCEIYDIWSDGMFIYSAHSLEVGYCNIYNVNTSHPNYPDDGDNIHTDDINTIYVHHNILDHTTQPGKFCLLLGSAITGFTSNATVEYNTMKRTRTGTDNTVYYSNYAHGSKIIFRYNKVQDALVGLQSRTYDMQIYYNLFTNVGQFMELNSPTDFVSNPKVWNNTIYNCDNVIYGYGENVDFKNNIIHTVTGTAFTGGSNLALDYNDYYNVPTFGNVSKGTHDYTSDPLFNNLASSDFTLKSGSPCIDKGANVLNSTTDLAGNVSPFGTSVDMGAYEYRTGAGGNVPIVNLTSPGNGQNFTAPASVLLTASASVTGGTIAKVEYYNGTVKLGESTSAPYSFTWTTAPAGTYNLTAVATDNLNTKSTSSIVTINVTTGSGNLPVVGITAPGNGQNFTAPASILLTASASVTGGTISKVEYYNGTVKLGESASAPYSYTWTNAPTGIYDLTAVATTNLNAKSTSSIVTIYVNGSTGNAPVVGITSPGNGQSFTAPASIQITTSASVSGGTIAKVEFFNGTVKLGESTSAPFSYTWASVPAGTYSLTAVATSNLNIKTTSSIVTVTVNPSVNILPAVTLTGPGNGQNYKAPAKVIITANASDANGTISKVEFYNGTVKLGQSTVAPYSYTWKNVPVGVYNIKAIATDNSGGKTTSGIATIYVNQ